MKNNLMFRDGDYRQALDEMGFLVAPLFEEGEIEKLKDLYQLFAIDNNVSGLIASHSKIGPERNIKLRHAIRDIVMPSLENHFNDFDFFIGGYMVKEAGTGNELPLHQDWNILDESQFTSYQIWIPLELSHPANGGMYVLPYSHHFYKNYRSGSYGIPTVPVDENLRPLITDMIIPPGSALIFHNALFHASYPNSANQNRVAVIVSIFQKNSPLEYFHKNTSENRTEIYGISPESFLTNLNTLENGGIPETLGIKETLPLNPVDNRKIAAAGLADKLHGFLSGHARDYEPLQLHILKDKGLENQLQRDGYVVLDFLSPETVNVLKTKYEELFAAGKTSLGRFTPMEHASPATKRLIHSFILEQITPALRSYFNEYQTPIASYFTKYARSAGDLSWHTDASIMLNTNLEPHYGIWCPLLDVNENNGAFCLIKGSHKFSHTVFLPGLGWPYSEYKNRFDKIKTVLNMKAGQIVLFDLRLIHHATPNNSDEDRIVFCVRLTHKKSRYYSFSCKNENEQIVDVYQENADYYLRDDWAGDNQAANRNIKIGEMQHIYAHINRAAIEETLETACLPPVLNR